jgi:hypothetical protein
MAETITKKLVQINNTEILKSWITKYSVGYMTLWGDDTGRDLEGNENGTFKGLYPKIFLGIKRLTTDQMSALLVLLNLVTFNVTYYDPETKDYKTLPNYRADFTVDLESTKSGKYRAFEVNLIPRQKRT